MDAHMHGCCLRRPVALAMAGWIVPRMSVAGRAGAIFSQIPKRVGSEE